MQITIYFSKSNSQRSALVVFAKWISAIQVCYSLEFSIHWKVFIHWKVWTVGAEKKMNQCRMNYLHHVDCVKLNFAEAGELKCQSHKNYCTRHLKLSSWVLGKIEGTLIDWWVTLIMVSSNLEKTFQGKVCLTEVISSNTLFWGYLLPHSRFYVLNNKLSTYM